MTDADKYGSMSDMQTYLLKDEFGEDFTYEASDMRMALVVHEHIVGTPIMEAKEV